MDCLHAALARAPRRLALLFAVAAVACGEKTSGTDDATDTDATTGTNAGACPVMSGKDAACYDVSFYCSAYESPTCDNPELLTCKLTGPCPTVVYKTWFFGEYPDEFDEDAAACVLDSLRAGAPGRYVLEHWRDGGYAIRTYELQVLKEGAVYIHYTDWVDLGGDGRLTWGWLPDADCFDGCEASPEAFEGCVAALMELCLPGPPTCF